MSRAASPTFPSGLLIVALVLIFLLSLVWWLNRPSTASEWALQGPVSPSMTLPPLATVARPAGPYQGFCDGSEVFCLSAESSQPADTLRQLAAALSVEPTQRYQIQLTIMPLEQEATSASEAMPPDALPVAAP